MNRVFVSLGSNIDPECNLPEAVRRLASCCRLLAVSPVYETEPVGRTDQPSFLNAAVLIETDLTAADLKARVLQAIEDEMGRVRTQDKNAPRIIDLDISLFNDEVLELGHRHIPDPEIREFVHIARPLADLAPRLCHPETGQPLLEIAEGLPQARLLRRDEPGLLPEPNES
jgi:2-amino-4-hydroxy-6-hydroxymethyldihydropteridine diphosphokinase